MAYVIQCPKCGSKNFRETGPTLDFLCNDCDGEFSAMEVRKHVIELHKFETEKLPEMNRELEEAFARRGIKADDGKEPMGLLPGVALREISRVLDYGAKKYAPNNWKHVRPGSRYLDAALRHLTAYADGEDNDPESDLHHLAHAGCCVLFMLGLIDDGESCRHPSE